MRICNSNRFFGGYRTRSSTCSEYTRIFYHLSPQLLPFAALRLANSRNCLLTRWKATSSWWIGPVPHRAFQTLVVFLFWRRPYRRPPQGGGSGLVRYCGEVQETAVCCYEGSRILLVTRRENVHSFCVD